MEETPTKQQTGGMSKKTIAIVIGLLLIIGGSVTAYVLLDKTAKEQYFTAESDTMTFIAESFEGKYELESKWADKTAKHANRAEHRIQLALDSGMGGNEFGALDPLDIMSSLYFAFDLERDPDEQELSLAIGAELGNIDIGNIILSLAEHDLFLELPFTEDTIHIADHDINRMLYEEDPMSFPEEGLIDFTDFFDYSSIIISEEDIDYITKEYGEYLYDLLPDSAFTDDKESIEVLGNDVKATKLTFELTEKEVKEILTKLLTKIAKDEKIKDVLRDQLEAQMITQPSMVYSPYETADEEIDAMMEEFNEGIESAIDGIDSLYMPDGFSSTIWVDGSHIVQRDFTFSIGPDDVDYMTLDIQGEHTLSKELQEHEMTVTVDDGDYSSSLNIEGEFNWDGKKGDDYLIFHSEDIEMKLEIAEELTSKDTKEFMRSFIVTDEYGDEFGLEWSGEATYKDEQMKSSHKFTAIDETNPEAFGITIDKKGSIIKEVSVPSKSDAVLLGEMEPFEIEMYIDQLELEFEQWISDLMGGGGLFGF